MDVLKKLSHRYVSKLHSRPASHPQSEGESNHLQSSAYCQTASGIGVDYEDHNVYENRKSTAEEPEEDEDINLIKQKIRGLKLEDLSSTEYALYLARQAEEKGRSALMNLAEQADRIQDTKRNLALLSTQSCVAEGKIKTLNSLNRSMFAVHISNPFAKLPNCDQETSTILGNRDAKRKAAWESQTWNSSSLTTIDTGGANSFDRYQFEADSDDDEIERQMNANLDNLHGAARRLNLIGRAIGDTLDTQNREINRITDETDKVDEEIERNIKRIERIK